MNSGHRHSAGGGFCPAVSSPIKKPGWLSLSSSKVLHAFLPRGHFTLSLLPQCPSPFLCRTNFCGVLGEAYTCFLKRSIPQPLSPAQVHADFSYCSTHPHCYLDDLLSTSRTASTTKTRPVSVNFIPPLLRAWLSACMAQKQPTSILTAGHVNERTRGLDASGQLFRSLRGNLTDTCTPRSYTFPRIEVQDGGPT